MAWGSVCAVALCVVVPLGCGNSGGSPSGGTCYMATDCAAGLYCYGVTATMAGKCTSNANMAQPPAGEGGIPDGGIAPMLDSPVTDTPVTPMDVKAPTDTKPPPKDTSTPTDTGSPPEDSGGKG